MESKTNKRKSLEDSEAGTQPKQLKLLGNQEAETPEIPEGEQKEEIVEVIENEGETQKKRKKRVTSISGDQRVEQLRKYKEERGHLNVVRKDDHDLYHWLANQKTYYHKGKLSPSRIKNLEDLGVLWKEEPKPKKKEKDGKKRSSWEEKLQQIREFKEENGHTQIPTKNSLYYYLIEQKRKLKAGTLSSKKSEQLKEVGFDLESFAAHTSVEEAWQKRLEEINSFKEENGHTRVPPCSPLGTFLNRQLKKMKAGKLSEEKFNKLKEVGVDLNTFEYRGLAELLQ